MRTHRPTNIQDTLLDAAVYLIRLGYKFDSFSIDGKTFWFQRDGMIRRLKILRNGTCKIF